MSGHVPPYIEVAQMAATAQRQADVLASRVAELETALADEATRHHSLRWMLGLDTHEDEEPITELEAITNLRVFYRQATLDAEAKRG